MRGPTLAALLSAIVAVGAAEAEEAPCLTPAGAVTITGWTAPLTATLADGRRVRLADLAISQPTTPPASLPTGDAELTVAGEAPDRWGRILGDLVLKSTGGSLRHRLVSAGLAFVDPGAIGHPCDATLFAREREAEAAGRGEWPTVPRLAADDPDLGEATGRWVLVEGRVDSVGQSRRTVYLNFGRNFRTDFTVTMAKEDVRDWPFDPTSLDGETVRVRGVLDAWNGGVIRVSHPRQIERGRSPSR